MFRFTRSSSGLLAVLALLACATDDAGRALLPASEASTRRTISQGELIGFNADYRSHAWLGVPFARPPVGDLRWRAPQPPEAWTGTRDALAFGSPCPQYASALGGVEGGGPDGVAGSEDCLYLNVYSPRFGPGAVPQGDARLPVMVWIHGGGNTIGHAGFYNGGHLASAEDVIVVTLNYRLGPFGWFRHAALADGAAPEDASGNFGTLDMIRALEWVRENVAAFGGDPGNVTIFGESAGGTDVLSLLLSPRATGLFHRAISQSGSTRFSEVAEAENFIDDPAPGHASSSGEVLLRLLIEDGTVHDASAGRTHLQGMESGDVARYLRGRNVAQIMAAYPQRSGMIDMPKVFLDGTVLPVGDPREHLAREGGYNRVPIMLGTTRDENKLFMFFDPERVRRWFGVIPQLRDREAYLLDAEYLAKVWKATGADELAIGLRRVQGPSVFVYRFDWDEEPTVMFANLSEMLGAAHGFEIPFVFGHFQLGKTGNVIFSDENRLAREQLSARMMSYWAEFARNGDPGRGREGTLAAWAAWDDSAPAADRFMLLDTEADGGPRMSSAYVTRERIAAEIQGDARLATAEKRCELFGNLVNWSSFTREDYAAMSGCAALPVAEVR